MIRNHRLSRTQRRRLVLRTRARRHAHVLNQPVARNRQGSTLLVVMVLLGLLTVLGVIFYTFAAQERSNSEYYAEAAKNVEDPGLSADVLMDWGLQQLIIGTDPRLKNSALWGSRHSMLSTMVGVGDHRVTDPHPYNGTGVNLAFDGSGIVVDQNYDGTADTGQLLDSQGDPVWTSNPGSGTISDIQDLLKFNDSPSAQRLFERRTADFPSPDVDYTYPDINNLFLSYVGWTRDGSGNLKRVVIPSFHRPQYLRDSAGLPYGTGDSAHTNWYDAPELVNRLLRPHREHLAVPPSRGTNAAFRYIRDAAEATSLLGAGGRPFPWIPMDGTYPSQASSEVGHQGMWNVSPPSGVTDDTYQYDADNDLDGVFEGIWIDLDFPVQEQPGGGKLFVPMYSFTVHDLDSLINLNAHGNLANLHHDTTKRFLSNAGGPFGDSEFLSQSNLGLGPAEVNPGWALTARPGDASTPATAFQQHREFYGQNPTTGGGAAGEWRELANMELAWLKLGRPELNGGNIDEIYAGVYGEEHLIYQGFSSRDPYSFPMPGRSFDSSGNPYDDNGDQYEGNPVGLGGISGLAEFGYAGSGNFRHPLDFTGLGRYTNPSNRLALDVVTGSNVQWQRYANYSSRANGVMWGLAGGTLNVQAGNLMYNAGMSNDRAIANGLLQDPYEIAFYANDRVGLDDLLGPDEMMHLQLSNSEILRLGLSSRVAKLAPFNFAKDVSTNPRGADIRKRFTTTSNDRKQFSLPSRRDGTGRVWEYTYDNPAQSGVLHRKFPPQFGVSPAVPGSGAAISGLTPIPRYLQELNSDNDALPNTEPNSNFRGNNRFDSDPFRNPLRALLEIEENSTVAGRLQRRFSLNHLLVFDQDNKLSYRKLTEHPRGLDATVIPVATQYPPQSAVAYEYWARRDRQQLCRDIYVMLYLMGGGCDDQDGVLHNGSGVIGPNGYLRSNANEDLYTDEQLREMAQYAVNIVDRMDTDNVITMFEYDKDLADGWNLDDNPYGDTEFAPFAAGDARYNPNYPYDSTQKGVVFGTEAQELTITEVLAIRHQLDEENPATRHIESMMENDHWFAYAELKNVAPYDLEFTSDHEAWHLAIEPAENDPYNPTVPADQKRRLIFRDGTASVTAGGRFTIGSMWHPSVNFGSENSVFAVDYDGNGTHDPIAPRNGGLNLDLVSNPTPTNIFKVTDAAGSPTNLTSTAGSWFYPTSYTDPSKPVHFILRRRAHPLRAVPTSPAEEADNPWVEVDRFVLTDGVRNFTLEDDETMASQVQSKLQVLTSRFRTQPFNAMNPTDHASSPIANTLGEPKTGAVPATVQSHTDRNYGSIGELLLVPTYAPWQTTSYLRLEGLSPVNQYTSFVPGSQRAVNGAGMILSPLHPESAGVDAKNNRWHRLLEFVEVPSRTNQNLGVGSDLEIPRVPGRVNLNMVRYPEILAALVDDPALIDLTLAGGQENAGFLNDANEGTGRDWWRKLLESRDVLDPMRPGDQLPMPGLPGAKPFRGFANAMNGNNSVEHTILRDLPQNPPATDPRALLEVGTQAIHEGQLPPQIRYGILSKLIGNTTPRSHCFAVFISVKYFEAALDPNSGLVRIGGPLENEDNSVDRQPQFRGFFVVDRSLLEQGNQSGGTGFSTFKPFVTHRKILQEP